MALDLRTERRQKARNVVQSTVLVGCLLAVATGVAWLMSLTISLVWTAALAVGLLALRPRFSPRTVLSRCRAQPLLRTDAPQLYRIGEELAGRAGLPWLPALYQVPSPVPNCFCVGRGNRSALAVSDGLLRMLTHRELAGVLAHEIGHLRARDATTMPLSDAISRFARSLAYLGGPALLVALPLAFVGHPELLLLAAVLVATPVVVTLLQLALSRAGEFDADLTAARLTGDPEGLARALEALQASTGRVGRRILLPPGRLPGPLVLQTHPPTAERTRRLRALLPRNADRGLRVGPGAAPCRPGARHRAAVAAVPGARW